MRLGRTLKKTLVLVSVCATMYAVVQEMTPPTPVPVIQTFQKVYETKRPVKFLFWTAFVSWLHHIPGVLRECNPSCELTTDKSALNELIAVVMHPYRLYKYYSGEMPPPYHLDFQRWIYLNQESPHLNRAKFRKLHRIFNWTMTYREDADIYYPYSNVVQRTIQLSSEEFESELVQTLSQKKNLVAWLVSNCGAPSQRDEIVRNLRAIIPVDVYGECGSLQCKHEENGRQEQCFTDISNSYKFYLAFENAVCQDYVTEKAYTSYLNTSY